MGTPRSRVNRHQALARFVIGLLLVGAFVLLLMAAEGLPDGHGLAPWSLP